MADLMNLFGETMISKLEPDNPLYLHASDSTNLTVVSIKLKGTENYTVWANAMILALRVKIKIGFVDGTFLKPVDNPVLETQWERCNSVVLTWILNSVSEELYLGHVYSQSAADVWKELRDTYDKIDGSVVFDLYQKINSFTQNGMPVAEYYHKLNIMWKQLDQILQIPVCTCNASTQFNNFNHLIKLMQFLMGLDSGYQSVRTNLLIREPLPSVKEAFSIVSREESHRGSNVMASKEQTVGFFSKVNTVVDNKRKFVKGSNQSLKCTHCNKSGHSIDRCFELIGYPPWMKSKNGQGKKIVSNNVINSGSSDVNKVDTASLTSDQVSKLFSLLNQKCDEGSVSCNVSGEDSKLFCFTSCSTYAYSFANLTNSLNGLGWICDSGANQHMVMNDKHLINQLDVSEYNIKVNHPNGTKALVTKIGDIKLNDKVVLYDVLVIPDYCVNLISVHKLAKDSKISVLFDENSCYLQDSLTKKTLVIGRQCDGLYFCGESHVIACLGSNNVDMNNIWHSRLGHPSEVVLNVLKNDLSLQKFDKSIPCEICHKSKQHREPFPLSDHKTKKLGELVHLDVWGPYRVKSKESCRYFLTVVDDYTRAVWVYLMKHKDEVFENVKHFVSVIHTQFEKPVKIFRTGNGTEFINNQFKDFLNKQGIGHQTTCVYTPQQNGIVERKHRHLLNVARSLLFQSGLPLRFWSECILTAAYLINRTPSSVLSGRSPYELIHGFKPSLTHLRVFGCLCFSTVLNNSDKFSSHADKCVLIGYSNEKKGYKLWNLEKRDIIFSRDVRFYESIFPFKSSVEKDIHVSKDINNLNFFNLYEQSDLKHSKGLGNPYDEKGVDHNKDSSVRESQQSNRDYEATADKAGDQPSSSQFFDRTLETDEPPQSSRTNSDLDRAEHEHVEHEIDNLSEGIPESQNTETNNPVLRRSTRSSVLPKRLDDFIIEGKVKYGLEKVVNYTNLTKENICFTSVLNKSVEPRFYHEACKDPNWVSAMNAEIEALNRNNTWDLVELPHDRKPIGCKWIFKIKYKSSGEIERYKARLVAKCYSQREGIDFDETFSPVVKMITVRSVITLAVYNSWKIYQLDINNAFLYGDLVEDVYMKLPEGYFDQNDTRVCKLNKSLYGLKQAPRMWNAKLVSVLYELGFVQSKCDHLMFVKSVDSVFIVLLVYVDDILITGNNENEIENVKSYVQSKFKIKDLGTLKYFLGIEVLSVSGGLCLSQRKYCLELLAEYGMSGCKPVHNPIEQNHVVTALCDKECDNFVNVTGYQRLIGKLIYLTHTRPDIAYSVHVLSQYMHKPTKAHMLLAMRVLRYLKGAPGKGLFFGKHSHLRLSAYAYSDWGKCRVSRKSVTGYCVFLGTSLIAWKSKKQSTVSRSTAEAEYRAMCTATCELMWLVNLLKELHVEVKLHVSLYCDNSVALSIAANPVFHDRTKHFEIDLFFLREKIQAGIVKTVGIKTDKQIADIFTKGLLIDQHRLICKSLNMLDMFSNKSEGGGVKNNYIYLSLLLPFIIYISL
ncbi:putative RNA-directed DNA polymerase [Helianthus annuus]|nr:putative RNA-directed DNA polymerase [Helianthus annuus]